MVSPTLIKTVDGDFILHPVYIIFLNILNSILEALSNNEMFYLLDLTRFSVLACFPIECGGSVRNCDATNKPIAADTTFREWICNYGTIETTGYE